MDTKQVQCFLAIAECKNFTEAASRLFISQPAVSRHIFNLETELGVTLFRRDKRSVDLTPAGTVIQQGLLRLSDDFGIVLKEAKRVQQDSISTLHVGIAHYISYHSLPPVVYQFLRNTESKTVNIESFEYSSLGDGLSKGKYDIIITFRKTLQSHDDFDIKPIMRCPVHVFCAKTLINSKEHLGIRALDNMDYFVPDPRVFPGAEEDIRAFCSLNDLTCRSITVVPNTTTLVIMCTTEQGAIFLHTAARGLLDDLAIEKLVSFPTQVNHELVVAYKKDSKNPYIWALAGIIDEMSRVNGSAAD